MKSLPLSLCLVGVSLAAHAQTYPIYKSTDPKASAQRDVMTQSLRAQESRRAMDSAQAPQEVANLRPVGGDGGDGTNRITVIIPVYRDGYRVTGTATANYSQWAPGTYRGGASIADWGGRMVVPFWNSEKAAFQIGPDLGVQQAQTFWWGGLTPETLPGGLSPKPYFAKPTYHHGVNTVSNFQTYWPGFFTAGFGAFIGTNIPEFGVINNAHNEGGNDHPNMAMVVGLPNAPYQAGIMAQWTDNHSEWYWPSAGKCYLASMELWDSVRTGYGSAPFTFEVECISGVQANGDIEIPVPSLNSLWGQNRVVESVVLSSPIKVEKYTKTTYITKVISDTVLNGTSEDAYIAKMSQQMSQKATVWPDFKAESPTPHNVGSAVFIKAKMQLAQ